MLRAITLASILVVPAAADIRCRMVYRDTILMCWAVSACFLAWDVAQGGLQVLSRYALAALGAAMGAALVRAGAVGSADGHVIAVSSIMMPEHDGVPVAVLGIASGLVGGLASIVLHNAACNAADAFRGLPHCTGADFATAHIKRAGEEFAVKTPGPSRVSVRDGTVRSVDGSEYFAPRDASGMPVGVAAPAVAYLAAGVSVVSLLAVL